VCLQMLSWSHLCWPYLLYVPVVQHLLVIMFSIPTQSLPVNVVSCWCSTLRQRKGALGGSDIWHDPQLFLSWYVLWVHSYLYYWLVGWNMFYFSICIGKNIPNWPIMTSMFQSGWNHQPDIILCLKLSIFLGLPVDHDSVFKHIVQPMVTMRDPPF